MNRCTLTYEPCKDSLYSKAGLKKLSQNLSALKVFAYTADEQRQEAMSRATKISIQGVQPKLSAVLNIKENRFEIVDSGGRYILKPQHTLFPQLPENEDLTMRMAEMIGIKVPLHGLIWAKDKTLTYFIKRFDRAGHKDKLPVEDFAQLAGMNRDTKYNYSMEKLINLLDTYCSFPVIEKAKLFRLVIFNFLVGNEDMHLKNYSVITMDGKIELSPAYDLLNTTILLKGGAEEIALSVAGKKRRLDRQLLLDYFGKKRCGLNDKVIDNVLQVISEAKGNWQSLISISFLSEELKSKYLSLMEKRFEILGL